MANVATATLNKPAWIDLAAKDAEAERQFYARLFGWDIQVNPDPQRAASASVGVSVSTHPPPSLQVDDAVERLNATGWPFVFFEDVASGRGCVLYRRYDGHYGLITPGI